MSALDEMIKEIQDVELRGRIQLEFNRLRATKKFGLVFESSAEFTPLFNVPIKKNSLVMRKAGSLKELYRVTEIAGEKIFCIGFDDTPAEFSRDELVRVARLGEPIYPALKKLDEVCNAPDSELWHLLIEADNFHALQLLKYVCRERKADCIYIDPPYNTGARDWKYNNDFVDGSDPYRHSKWLSMMERRLKLAKEILSDDGAIFISIDDNEQATLKLLCDEIFGQKNFVAQFCVKRSGGRQDSKFFAVVNEFLFCYAKNAPTFTAGEEIKVDGSYPKFDAERGRKYKTQLLRKWGANSRRVDRPNLFYPIPAPDGTALYPMLSATAEGRWRWGKNKMREAFADGLIEFVKKNGEWVAYEKIFQPLDGEANTKKFTTWLDENFSDGAEVVKKIFDDNVFDYPKALGLMKKIFRMATNKPDALIVDFFAGSGTTLHTVNLLNAEDGGKRQCILVTNNEVSDAEEKSLRKQGLTPADDAWQALGIARHVTWPRTVCSIKGQDINGAPLNGNYLGSERAMADGFKANAAFFKLDFLDKNAVEFGRAFKELLPLLWLKAGGIGRCPSVESVEPYLIFSANKFAVLVDERSYHDFAAAVDETAETIFFVTDSREAYRAMRKNFAERKTYQLYRDYLENFKIGGDGHEV